MSRRYFKLTNFRNIGLDSNTDNKIIINNSLEKGKMGNLIILIGANNSGKSNVLDAIIEYGQKKLSNKDITTLSFNDEDRKPLVSLVYQDENGTIENELNINGEIIDKFNIKNYDERKITFDEAKNTLNIICDACNKYGYLDQDAINLLKLLNEQEALTDELYGELKRIIKKYEINGRSNSNFKNIFQKIPTNITINFDSQLNKSEKYIMLKYDYPLKPDIINYKEKIINDDDMQSNISNLKNNKFFKSLFTAIDVDISEIINGYDQYNKFHNIASINKMKKMIEEKIDKLNDQFNKLYFAENDKYKFSVELESEKIMFGMARGKDDDPIMIELQSTGFRWFFNFYFNFICSNKLISGDIIIMDEPATNLHPMGQIELRKFIKDFAIKNDLTFIIATHSPFLIDVDNYDELRIITMNNNRAKIDNLFTAINNNDPESILPIKDALTIKQNVLYDFDSKVIWVEGVTDYNYLTMFKKLLNIKNINFIPYNGNGKTKNETKEILSKITNVKFYNCGILVDADKAGNSMAELCKETIFKDRVYKISDIDSSFIEIEDLFSNDDRKKYDSLNKASRLFKKAFYSSMMKNTTKLDDYTEESINNFKNLFALICNETLTRDKVIL